MGNAFKESGVGVHDRRMRGQHLGGTQVSIQRTQPESSVWTYAKCAKVILSLASISILFYFVCMCLVNLCAAFACSAHRHRVIRFPETGATHGCEPPDMHGLLINFSVILRIDVSC